MKLVSVIIPIYNGERYIDKCISHILKQSYKNIEIICVPNNCKDDSVSICEKWGRKDCRVKVFVNERKGTSLAIKRGIEESGGEYILFMDQDDLFASDDAIEKMVLAIEADRVQICQFDYIVQYPIPIRRKVNVVKENRVYERNEMLNGPLLGAVQGREGNFNVSVWSKIYDSRVLKSAVARIEDSLTCAEEMQLNMFAFSDDCTRAVSGRKEAYYLYRVGRGITANPDSIFTLLEDYRIVKMDIYNEAKRLKLEDRFFLHLWSEALYCYRDAIYSCLDRHFDKVKTYQLIQKINNYEYIKIAKAYFQDKIKSGWLETQEARLFLSSYEKEISLDNFRFMCTDCSVEEYYDWCLNTLPKKSVITSLKVLIRKFV